MNPQQYSMQEMKCAYMHVHMNERFNLCYIIKRNEEQFMLDSIVYGD